MTRLPVVPEDLCDLYQVEDPRLSPDGRTVVFVRMQIDIKANAYRRAIWLVPADGSAEPRQFTAGSAQDYAPRWSPDGRQLLFVSTRGGSPQLFLTALDGGESRQITHMPEGATAPAWSPDGRWIAFISSADAATRDLEDQGVTSEPGLSGLIAAWNKEHREQLRDPRVVTRLPYRTGTSYFDGYYRHIYVIPAAGGGPRRLSQGDFHHTEPVWTPDSRSVVTNSNRDQSTGDEFFELWSTILRYDLATGEETIIAAEVSEEGRPVRVSPDGRWVAYYHVARVASPYQAQCHLHISPIEGGPSRPVTDESEVTVADAQWDADSQHLLLTIHDRGDARLVRMACTGGQPEALLDDGRRWIQQFSLSADGRMIAFTATSPTSPGELFIADLRSRGEQRLSDFNGAWLASHALSEPQETWYKGADDVDVQGWFMRPTFFEPGKRYPLAVEIHGGPQVMWGTSFWHEFQVLASAGYYVFFCNPRGSSGYGRQFQLARLKGGYTDAPDMLTGADVVLAREPDADPDRMVVLGGSYGGFLTGWIVGHYDRFKAAVSQRGVYDQLNMFGSGDIPESIEWYHNGLPRVENLMELWEYSPASYASQVTTPTLLEHSEQDYRVPISQAETFFAALRRHGNRDAIMVRYPNEGHEISRNGQPLHRIDRLRRFLNWFDRFVQPDKLGGVELAEKDLATALAAVPGWAVIDGHLTRRVECGAFAIARRLAEQVGALAASHDDPPAIEIDGARVTLRLSTPGRNKVTDRDVQAARMLNRQVF